MKKKIGFGIFVGVISLINLTNLRFGLHPVSLVVSILGIIGSVFYLLDKKWAINLLMIWAYSQIIVIEPIWDASQIFKIKFGFTFNEETSKAFSLELNIIGILYVSIVKLVFLNSLIGKEIRLKSFKQDSFLNDFLPCSFTIDRMVSVDKEKGWFLIKQINTDKVICGLIKTKDPGTINPKKKGQILQFRIVENFNKIEDNNSSADYKVGGFVRIQ
jgi:hypothetical protein